jgi:hypothetical protein
MGVTDLKGKKMTKKEKIEEIICEKYDMDLLESILRFARKNPSYFDWDYSKKEVTYTLIEELLVNKFKEQSND